MDWAVYVLGVCLGLVILLPLGWKWEIDKSICILSGIVIGLFSGFIVSVIGSLYSFNFYGKVIIQIAVIIAVTGILLAWRFFRDPDRDAPDKAGAIISPADGEILYMKRSDNGQIPFSEKNGKKYSLEEYTKAEILPSSGTLIGIAMNFLDVHVNRAPIEGKVVISKRVPGLYLSLKKLEAVIENERRIIVIEENDFKIGIIQIASRLVRKIVSYVNEGEEILRGQRIGMIRFGSQVDVFIPDSREVQFKVAVGQKVKAGLTILAVVQSQEIK